MCITPSFVWLQRGPDWEQIPKSCGDCWRCKSNRLNDHVGRAMAEASTSSAVCTLTLTYAPRSDLADKVLDHSHFQLFIKRLRRAGHLVRYLVAGEYGSLKDRAHFHAILFFTKIVPCDRTPFYNRAHLFPETSPSAPFSDRIPQKEMCHISEWPHGHITADWSSSEQAMRYVCKYLLADDKNNAWFSLSKKPSLGHAFFQQKAAKAVALGVLPSSFEYLPPGCSRTRPYLMTGATRRDYLNAITVELKDRPKMSEWVQKAFDTLRRLEHRDSVEQWQKDHPQEAIDAFNALIIDRQPEDDAAFKQKLDMRDAWQDYVASLPYDEAIALQSKSNSANPKAKPWQWYMRRYISALRSGDNDKLSATLSALEPFLKEIPWPENPELAAHAAFQTLNLNLKSLAKRDP